VVREDFPSEDTFCGGLFPDRPEENADVDVFFPSDLVVGTTLALVLRVIGGTPVTWIPALLPKLAGVEGGGDCGEDEFVLGGRTLILSRIDLTSGGIGI
jgi:hypothetical protein